MAEELDVYIRSFQQTGEETPELGLVRLFRLHPLRAVEFVQSVPRVVKRRVAREQAERYATSLRQIGAEVELRASAIVPQRIMSVTGATLADELKDPNESGRTLTLPPPAADGGSQSALSIARKSVTSRTIVMAAPAAPTMPEVIDTSITQPGFVLPMSFRPPQAAPQASWSDLDRTPAVAVAQATSWPPLPAHASAAPPSASPSEAPMPLLPSLKPEPMLLSEIPAHGRPDWIVDDSLYRARVNEMREAAAADPSAPQHVPPDAPLELELDHTPLHAQRASATPETTVRRSLERAPRTSHVVAQAVRVTRPSAAPRTVAQYIPHELATIARMAVQALVCGLVFGVISWAHSCSGHKDVDAALAAWATPGAGSGSGSASAAAGPTTAPTPASGGDKEGVLWCESEMHQFSNGDKDIVRALIHRVTDIGARVQVADFTQSGFVTIASELHVELPTDLGKRRAIYEVIRAFRSTVWHMDPGESHESDPFGGKTSIVIELS